MKTAELTGNSASSTAAPQEAAGLRSELLEALAGKQADRDRAVADKTRRVVLTSLGVLKDQEKGRRHARSLALAILLLAFLALGPFLWHVAEDLIGGEHLGDVATQFSLMACILCPAVLAAVLVVGWPRGKR